MEDLAGLGKIAEAILDKIAAVTGTLYEPTRVRRLGRAQSDVEAELILKKTAAELEAEDMRRRHQAKLDTSTPDPELLRGRAGQRLITQEIKRQENLELIVHDALAASGSGNARDIEDDWMEAFIQCAQNISAEGVRHLWSRILAKQATEGQPVISRATLDAMRLLEPSQAANFERAIQILIVMGQIMDVDPHGDPDIAFNVNALESLALEDIGFLKRIQEKEAGLGFTGFTFSFWNPIAAIESGDQNGAVKTEWNNPNYREYVLPLVKDITGGEHDTRDLRKDTPIDRYILTSRGFELASILIEGFYDHLEAKEAPDIPALGKYADPTIRERVKDYWADQFNEKGSVVVFNRSQRNKEGRSVLHPDMIFDSIKKNWVDIS